MWPSPSCGSPPNWRGASWKLSTSTLTTTAWLVWRAPLRGEITLTLGSPGTAAALASACLAVLAAAQRQDGQRQRWPRPRR